MSQALAQRELVNSVITSLVSNAKLDPANPKKRDEVIARFKRAKKQFGVITSLRALTDSESSYSFKFKSTNSDSSELNLGINENDIFIVTGVRLGVKRIPTTSSGTVISWGNAFPTNTYVDENLHPNVNERIALRSLFNGKLSGTIGGAEVLPKLNTAELRRVPNQQYFAQASTNRGFQAEVGQGDFMVSNGFTPLTPSLVVAGNSDHDFMLNFLAGARTNITGALDGASTPVESNHRNYVELSFCGVLIKGAAQSALEIEQ